MGVGRGQGARGLAAGVTPRDVSQPRASRRLPTQARYEGGVSRASARVRAAHAAKPQIALDDLAGSVGRGAWSTSADRVTARLKAQRQLSSAELVKQVKAGKAIDTLAAHTLPNGNLTSERHQLHDRIIENLLQGKGVHEGSAKAIFTAGGPASGKSGLLKTGTAKFERRLAGESTVQVPGDVVHVNPDVVREMLPEYQALKAAGREDAASLTHEEASALSKRVARIALARQHHVLVDTVGDSGEGKFAGKIRDALNAGHEVHVHYATVPVDQAIKRADKRGDETGRYVDHGYLREAHRSVSQRFSEVARIKGIHLTVHDTSARPLTLLASKRPEADNLSIRDRAGFERFLRKGGE